MDFDRRLNKIISRYNEINNQLIDPEISSDERVKLSKEYAELSPIIEAASALERMRVEMSDLSSMMVDPEADQEFRELAETEFLQLKRDEPNLQQRVQSLLLPRDRDDEKLSLIHI